MGRIGSWLITAFCVAGLLLALAFGALRGLYEALDERRS
jgi:hypothetical protein